MFMFACNTIDTWADVIANLTLSQFHKQRVKPGQLSFAPWQANQHMKNQKSTPTSTTTHPNPNPKLR